MNRNRSIPEKDIDFQRAQQIIVATADAHRVQWNLDFAWLDADLLPKKAEWETAWAAYENPATRTPTITFTKNEKRKAYEKPLRLLVRSLQSNVRVTPDDLHGMGIAVPSSARCPAQVAADAPDINVNTSIIGRLIIYFFTRGSRYKKGKPAGQYGAEIRWAILDAAPARWDELSHSEFITNSPFTLVFEHNQRGKTVYFALRWENTRGEKGPRSEIQSAIIP
jgi:hypothetical protein